METSLSRDRVIFTGQGRFQPESQALDSLLISLYVICLLMK